MEPVDLYIYRHTKYQLSSSISCGYMQGSRNKKWGLLTPSDAPSGQIFISSPSTCTYLAVNVGLSAAPCRTVR